MFGTGKEEADGKADNYRVRRMFPFRIQKMLGDGEEKMALKQTCRDEILKLREVG